MPTVAAAIPRTPSGTTTDAAGTDAARSATVINHHNGADASCAVTSANEVLTTANTAVTMPTTVMGATTGETSTFATTPTTLNVPAIAATTGAVTTWAAAATATTSAAARGHPRARSQSTQIGATSTSPAVANTDNTNPTSTASRGHHPSSANTAPHKAGTACFRLPVTKASKPIDPITAARNTLGDGRATTTKAIRTTKAIVTVARGPIPMPRNTNSTAPIRIEKFAPYME